MQNKTNTNKFYTTNEIKLKFYKARGAASVQLTMGYNERVTSDRGVLTS